MDKDELIISEEDSIRNHIFTVRDRQVMIDKDLALLYGVPTKRLNEQVKRNTERFPEEFCFQLTDIEIEYLKSQIVTSSLRSQFATSNKRGGRRYVSHVFTEQGIAMLAGVLNSKVAIQMSIRIINEFVAMRHVLRENGYLLERVETIEKRQMTDEINTEQKFEQVFDALSNTDSIPKQKLFFDGQFFDAHVWVSKIIRSAKKQIILIDNFIDESVLILLIKRHKNVEVTIYAKSIPSNLAQDVARYNAQYPTITIKELKLAHDRFLIIDGRITYHFGASLKDLGKKWFACTKLEQSSIKLLKKLS